MDWVPETWVLEALWRNGFNTSWARIFFIFFAKFFGIFDDFSKWRHAAKIWKIIIYAKNLTKKWRKSLFNLPSNPFFGWFWVPENLMAYVCWIHIFSRFLVRNEKRMKLQSIMCSKKIFFLMKQCTMHMMLAKSFSNPYPKIVLLPLSVKYF